MNAQGQPYYLIYDGEDPDGKATWSTFPIKQQAEDHRSKLRTRKLKGGEPGP